MNILLKICLWGVGYLFVCSTLVVTCNVCLIMCGKQCNTECDVQKHAFYIKEILRNDYNDCVL